MKTLVWFYMIFSVTDPHATVAGGEPLIMHFDMPAAECEQAARDNPSYHGPVGNLPGYSQIFMTWCEDPWPMSMDEEVAARQ